MMNFIYVSDRGDESSEYNVELDKSYTIGEFIDAMLKERPDEWGRIRVLIKPLEIFSPKNPCYEYSHGKLKSNIPQTNILTKPIRSIKAHSGWTLTDYFITLDTKM